MRRDRGLFDAALHANWVLHTAAEAGVPRKKLAGLAGLPPEGYADPMQPIPYGIVAGLIESAVAYTGQSDFGLRMGAYAPPELMGLMGYFLVNQPSLREILQFSYDLLGRISNVFRADLSVSGNVARMALYPGDADAPMLAQLAEFHCAVFLTNTRAYIDTQFSPQSVAFAHAEPIDSGPHRRLFRCPVRFGAPATQIAFGAAWLERRAPGADARLQQALAPYVEQGLERLPQTTALSDRVRTLVQQRLGQQPLTLTAIAAALQMKPRTVQHRLRAEGATFQRIVDTVRRDIASEQLRAGVPVDALSLRLGFADRAVFHRAFRRWTGMTPEAFRAAAPTSAE